MSPTESAKALVADWYRWADRGMFISHCDRKALAVLEEAVTKAIGAARTETAPKTKAKGPAK